MTRSRALCVVLWLSAMVLPGESYAQASSYTTSDKLEEHHGGSYGKATSAVEIEPSAGALAVDATAENDAPLPLLTSYAESSRGNAWARLVYWFPVSSDNRGTHRLTLVATVPTADVDIGMDDPFADARAWIYIRGYFGQAPCDVCRVSDANTFQRTPPIYVACSFRKPCENRGRYELSFPVIVDGPGSAFVDFRLHAFATATAARAAAHARVIVERVAMEKVDDASS